MSTDIIRRIKVMNQGSEPIQLWIEPWAEDFVVEPTSELNVEFDGPERGEVTVCYIQGGLILHGFPGASASVAKGGTALWNAHERLQR